MNGTRDIAIATREQVTQLRSDVAQLQKSMTSIEGALSERKGAERLAKIIIGLGGGISGGAMVKFGTALLGLPLPK